MSGQFYQLERPEGYFDSSGHFLGYVVRVIGLGTRSYYLNFLCGMQPELKTMGVGGYGLISALFDTISDAHEASEKYYTAWHEEYDFELIDCDWCRRETVKNCLKTVNSQVMEFI